MSGLLLGHIQSLADVSQHDHDSIRTLIEEANPGEMAGLYNTLAENLLSDNPRHSIYYADTALKLSGVQGQEDESARAFMTKGAAYSHLAVLDSAIYYYKEADKIFLDREIMAQHLEVQHLIASLYRDSNMLKKSLKIYLNILSYNEGQKDSFGISRAYYNIASTYHSGEKLDSALIYYDEALNYSAKNADKEQLGNIYNRLGNIYFSWGNYDKSLEYYLMSLQIFESIGDSTGLSKAYNNIGVINHDWKNFNESLKYYNLSYQVDSLLKNITGQSQTLNNIAILYEDMGERQKSMSTYQRSLKLAKEAGDNYQLAVTNSNIGGLYLEDGEFDLAEEYFIRTLEEYKKANSDIGIAETDILFGNLYHERGEYSRAEEYYLKGLEYALENKLVWTVMNAYEGLAANKEKEGNYEEALNYTQKYHLVSDSVFNLSTSQQIALLSNAYEIQKRNQEYEIQQLRLAEQNSRIKRQEIAVISLSALILLVVIYTLITLRQYKLRIRAWRQLLLQHNKILKNRQELIQAKLKAEQSDRLKSAFLVNLSHELRTPMNGIMGFTDLLQKGTATQEQQQTYLSYIASSSRQLLKVLNDIIDISAIETKQLEIKYESCNLHEMMMDLLVYFEKEKKDTEKDHIKLSYDVPEDEDMINFTADKRRLNQVVSNLLSNALSFTQQGQVSFGYTIKDDKMIKIFVRDTGIGIERSKFEIIFDRFRQIDDSTTRQHGGSGLGLAISKELVHMMNGEIYLESELGKGSTFYIEIPLVKD